MTSTLAAPAGYDEHAIPSTRDYAFSPALNAAAKLRERTKHKSIFVRSLGVSAFFMVSPVLSAIGTDGKEAVAGVALGAAVACLGWNYAIGAASSTHIEKAVSKLIGSDSLIAQIANDFKVPVSDVAKAVTAIVSRKVPNAEYGAPHSSFAFEGRVVTIAEGSVIGQHPRHDTSALWVQSRAHTATTDRLLTS